MKTRIKILATMLCLAIILGNFTTLSVSAADDNSIQPLKVTFDGTSVNLIKKDGTFPTIKTVKKKWGKAKTGKWEGTNRTEYAWTKGESTITVVDDGAKQVQGISISINDDNASLCGITVGMKKAKAVKKLNKLFGKENVSVEKDPEWGTYLYAQYGEYVPITMEIKNGKVASITWWKS